jgi:hypothetical protein
MFTADARGTSKKKRKLGRSLFAWIFLSPLFLEAPCVSATKGHSRKGEKNDVPKRTYLPIFGDFWRFSGLGLVLENICMVFLRETAKTTR